MKKPPEGVEMVKIPADCRSEYENAGADLLSNVFGKLLEH